MNNAVNILREGSMIKALTKLGIPIVIAMLIMAIYNVVDTFWVARLGTLPVAAVSVVFPLSLLFLGIGLMFGVGGGVYISRLLGAKQVVKAGQVASVSVITSVILAALIALVCNAFLPDILLFMGANEGMMHLAEAYGRLFIISCVIGALNVSMSNIIVSQGASKISATAMIIMLNHKRYDYAKTYSNGRLQDDNFVLLYKRPSTKSVGELYEENHCSI